MKLKVCGLSNAEHLIKCIEAGVDYCGFILNYPKSHRFIEFNKAEELTNIKKKKSKYVGVLVNPTNEEFEKYSKLDIDYFQIYGNFSKKFISDIKLKFNKKIIIAIQVKNKKDIFNYKKFEEVADIILWDSSGYELSLDWDFNWIKSIKSNVTKMIAGNINIDKLEKIFNLADIIDVSGALETNKVKDINKIKKFIAEVKKISHEN